MADGVVYGSIMVPLDGSGTAEWAIPVAAAIARLEDARLHLVLVHASLAHTFPDMIAAGYLDRWEENQREQEEETVRRLADQLGETGLDAVGETRTGDTVDSLVDRAGDMGLVVMTAHGWAGPERAWLGHVADGVVHHVRKPVLVVRAEGSSAPESVAGERPEFQRVLVATDGSEAARSAEAHAAHLARLFGAQLTLFRAVRSPLGPSSPYIPHAAALDREAVDEWEAEARRYVESRAASIDGVDVAVRVDTTYHPARAILEAAAAEEADLLAVGTHRDSRLARAVLGSVADKVVRGAGIPVLVAHADRS